MNNRRTKMHGVPAPSPIIPVRPIRAPRHGNEIHIGMTMHDVQPSDLSPCFDTKRRDRPDAFARVPTAHHSAAFVSSSSGRIAQPIRRQREDDPFPLAWISIPTASR
ncbi:hypothetical protein [Burkholderia pseudomallei]|uniref:hypothetical protein n=1 Tax=Burkholderia pseudomallei TaxID=28450 RepID=UPI000B08248D|nr:hypothetical protein [Burkholderia pseudomallei]MBF3652112.1 hypothetical protein [Burkholderia pseudomallei]MBF3669888.1 hypothetical protein [Burkholderia pseudomallei]MBF3775115.1 hypothetical protein [Burkholderia pseudomallei]MBF3873450.1 hypothetical protein [Burkholderia pseudomallei]MBF3909818.1 hypothetical protein [Burkholderia pseudomallei]